MFQLPRIGALVLGNADAELFRTELQEAGAGSISHLSTSRAWTGAEFKAIADRAANAASVYQPPGRR